MTGYWKIGIEDGGDFKKRCIKSGYRRLWVFKVDFIYILVLFLIRVLR